MTDAESMRKFTEDRGLDHRAKYVAVTVYGWNGESIRCGMATNIVGSSALGPCRIDESLTDADLVRLATEALP